METTRYDELRTLVAANFSETTQRLVDEALAYAAECLEKQVRYDGSPLLDHAAGVARIVISEIGLGRNSTLAAILHDVVRLAACGVVQIQHKQRSLHIRQIGGLLAF